MSYNKKCKNSYNASRNTDSLNVFEFNGNKHQYFLLMKHFKIITMN